MQISLTSLHSHHFGLVGEFCYSGNLSLLHLLLLGGGHKVIFKNVKINLTYAVGFSKDVSSEMETFLNLF